MRIISHVAFYWKNERDNVVGTGMNGESQTKYHAEVITETAIKDLDLSGKLIHCYQTCVFAIRALIERNVSRV